jgi:hypothetical protein
MDNLLPFLPRIAHIEPLNKRLLYVAGIKDAKIKFLNDHNKALNAYDSDLVEDKQEVEESNKGETGNKLDTWA